MRSIERLPESVHSSVRSGVVIRDFTTIVEELIFNSLEAGATKIYVAVGVGSCYVKVVDNGSGITRDGLVLLGERHATSKVNQITVMDTGVESLDFHGEALRSISNVSLLEIVTKVRGKPNGYRKIMKTSKCLFLGINDDKQEAGTTVMVRDIFHNQPVRRKHMESSPNKVLDSIKMSVLRVALVHVNVCFKVVDVESADDLLHTGPSSSPVALLSSNLGIEDPSSFCKVDFADGELKLSGFISDPCEKFYPKAIQYVYINSRFVCKGPIHKLVNQLAVKFDFSRSSPAATKSQNEKKNKYDICPTFILNLCCPRSYYDMITSEQSRRLVEFKDWGPVLTFIEKGITCLWAQNISHVSLTCPRRSCALESEMPDTSQKKRSIKQNYQICLGLSSQQKKLRRNYDVIPEFKEYVSSIGKPSIRVPELERHYAMEGVPPKTVYRSQSSHESLADYKSTMNNNIGSHVSPGSVFFLENVPRAYDSKVDDGPSSSAFWNILPEIDGNLDYMSTSSGVSADCAKSSDNKVHYSKDKRKSFLRSCSFERSSSHDRLPARDELRDFGNNDDARSWKRWVGCDDDMLHEIGLAICGRDLHFNESSPFEPSSTTHYDVYDISEFPDPSKQVCNSTSTLQSFRSEWSPMLTEKDTEFRFCNGGDDDSYKTLVEDYSEFDPGSTPGFSAWREEEDLKCRNTKDSWPQQNCSGMCSPSANRRGITEIHWVGTENVSSLKPFKRYSETNWSLLPSYVEESPRNWSTQLSYETPWEHESGRANSRNQKSIFNRKKCSVRSQSAPPCYKGKKRYLDLTDSSTALSARCNIWNRYAKLSSFEPGNSKHAPTRMKCLQKSFVPCLLSRVKSSSKDCSFSEGQGSESMQKTVLNQNGTSEKRDQFGDLETVERLGTKELWDSFDSRCKWRDCCPSTAVEWLSYHQIVNHFNNSCHVSGSVISGFSKLSFYNATQGGNIPHYKSQDILDISSDILDIASDSLVPKSIGRMTLEGAKVLNQVDKKFIAVVAGKDLAIIDQHAADERIRLEELRHKVLTGEMRTITYLDAEQELVLPEIGYQLLHNYAEQIQTWGWICNIHSQDTSSFTKHLDYLHRKPTVAKLHAVPCILGVNLTDVDLLEFLQQLADTDGSSTIPPSVNRILNNKACRGAIMFGDALLPSECSLIVEELKRTSLCFQCAHGRPTTVPLVNLDQLHHRITKHGSCEKSWHGLRHHKISLERSTRRLNST